MTVQSNKWKKKKPTAFKEECILITATKYDRNDEDLKYDYSIWQIKKLDGEDDNGNYVWYWGVLNSDGEEWGDIADLKADLYFTMPLLK